MEKKKVRRLKKYRLQKEGVAHSQVPNFQTATREVQDLVEIDNPSVRDLILEGAHIKCTATAPQCPLNSHLNTVAIVALTAQPSQVQHSQKMLRRR